MNYAKMVAENQFTLRVMEMRRKLHLGVMYRIIFDHTLQAEAQPLWRYRATDMLKAMPFRAERMN